MKVIKKQGILNNVAEFDDIIDMCDVVTDEAILEVECISIAVGLGVTFVDNVSLILVSFSVNVAEDSFNAVVFASPSIVA